mgnify:CR=1 FL=1
MGHSIYLADDEKSIRELLHSFLASDGYTVRSFESGDALLEAFRQEPAELVILDIMMPGTDGLTVCREIRAVSDIPIILLTAKDSELDYVMGISQGSDDYLTKPFRPTILLMKVKALLRRTEQAESEEVYRLGALSVNKTRHEVYAAGQEVTLTLKEFDLLCLLLENKGRVLTRDQLLNRIWGYGFDGESRTVDVHIRTLRQKLGECGEYIETVRGVGYKVGGNI